jgi:hypothetical protein
MPDVVLLPGKRPVITRENSVTVVALRQAGDFVFTVTVTDDAGLSNSAKFKVTVRPG